MASTDQPVPEPEKAAPPPETIARPPPRRDCFAVVDVVLRMLLFAAAVAAVVVMVTSKETKAVAFAVYMTANFKDSPAMIYFVAALSVAGFYALITTMVSFLALLKPRCSTKLLPHFVIFDVLMLGIVAAAAGTAGGVAYIGRKGNSRAGWTEICNVFEKFCHYVEASVAVSIFASIVLALLVINSAHSLSKRIPK